jgi:hypothetical protein
MIAHKAVKFGLNVTTEMALHVLPYNMTRVIAVLGVPELVRAMRA